MPAASDVGDSVGDERVLRQALRSGAPLSCPCLSPPAARGGAEDDSSSGAPSAREAVGCGAAAAASAAVVSPPRVSQRSGSSTRFRRSNT